MRISHLLAVALGVTLLALAPASAERQPFVSYGHPTLEAINDAYLRGDIDENHALLYRFFFVKAPERIPAELRIPSEEPILCATGILVEVYERYTAFPANLRELVDELRSRPGWLLNTITTTHYIVHYTTTGGDACTAAYAQTVADACELTWTTLHTAMNWDVPPGDGSNGGGLNLIDCYIHNLGSGILGMAEPEAPVTSTPEPYDCTGFFHVGNTIGSTGVRQSTTTHENMHVVQFGYYGISQAHVWFDENCAMMAQEWVYDNVNDYIGYLSAAFYSPYRRMNTYNGTFEYGQITWPMYLCEKFEPELVELIYNNVQTVGLIFNSFDNILPLYGTTMNQAFVEFRQWCWYTGTRNDGNHYSEANLWSIMLFGDRTYVAYPTGEIHPQVNMWPEPYSASIKRFQHEPGSTDNLLLIDYNGDPCTLGVDFMTKASGSNIFYEYHMELDANGDGHLEIQDWDTLEYAMSMVYMKRQCNVAKDYLMWVDTGVGTSSVPEMGPTVRIYTNYPNPLADNTVITYSLSEAGRMELQVVDASGRVVRDLFSGQQYVGDYEIVWDGQDNAGRPVANGVYFARLLSADKQTVREMTVVR